MFDWAIKWSLKNRLAVVLLYVLMAGASIIAALHMAVDVFPEFAPPQVQIQTEVPGYSTKDVEALVTRPIEIVLQGAPYIDQIRSNSSVGLSRIIITFSTLCVVSSVSAPHSLETVAITAGPPKTWPSPRLTSLPKRTSPTSSTRIGWPSRIATSVSATSRRFSTRPLARTKYSSSRVG